SRWSRATDGRTEQPHQPGLPGAPGPVGIRIIGEEMVADHHRSVETVDESIQGIGRAHAQERRRLVVHDALDRLETLGGQPYLVALGRVGAQSQPTSEHRHRVLTISHGRALRIDADGEPPREVREVLDQLVEVHRVTLAHALVLRFPVLPQHAAVDVTDRGPPRAAILDAVVEPVERSIRSPRAGVHESLRRVPDGDRRILRVPAYAPPSPAPLAGLNLALAHEPRVHPGPGGDRLPDLFGRRADLHVLRDLEPMGHGYDPPSTIVAGVAGAGCPRYGVATCGSAHTMT